MLLPPVNHIFSREISRKMPRSARCDRVAEIPLEWNLLWKLFISSVSNLRTIRGH